MIYKCYECDNYNFNSCTKCGTSDKSIPLDPVFYPEFEYKSGGFVSDIFFKKTELKKIDIKLDSVLSKYHEFKTPYFINYCFLADDFGSNSFKDLDLFKQVLLNLGFFELNEYPGLIEKLIRSTQFKFDYDDFVKRTIHHIKESLFASLESWIEEKGNLYIYDLPLFIHYIHENLLFKKSILYSENNEVTYLNHPDVYRFCAETYFKIRSKRFQLKLEDLNTELFITIHAIDDMDGYEFEDFLVELFKKRGYEVQATRKGKDQGADLFVESFGKKMVIQAKNYQGTVGNKAVQEAHAAKDFYSCDSGMVITNSTFTASAKELALGTGIELVDRDRLQRYLDDYNYSIGGD